MHEEDDGTILGRTLDVTTCGATLEVTRLGAVISGLEVIGFATVTVFVLIAWLANSLDTIPLPGEQATAANATRPMAAIFFSIFYSPKKQTTPEAKSPCKYVVFNVKDSSETQLQKQHLPTSCYVPCNNRCIFRNYFYE